MFCGAVRRSLLTRLSLRAPPKPAHNLPQPRSDYKPLIKKSLEAKTTYNRRDLQLDKSEDESLRLRCSEEAPFFRRPVQRRRHHRSLRRIDQGEIEKNYLKNLERLFRFKKRLQKLITDPNARYFRARKFSKTEYGTRVSSVNLLTSPYSRNAGLSMTQRTLPHFIPTSPNIDLHQ